MIRTRENIQVTLYALAKLGYSITGSCPARSSKCGIASLSVFSAPALPERGSAAEIAAARRDMFFKRTLPAVRPIPPSVRQDAAAPALPDAAAATFSVPGSQTPTGQLPPHPTHDEPPRSRSARALATGGTALDGAEARPKAGSGAPEATCRRCCSTSLPPGAAGARRSG